MSTWSDQFAQVIKDGRQSKGASLRGRREVTQAWLAKRITDIGRSLDGWEVSRSTVSRWEDGSLPPPKERRRVMRIGDALDLKYNERSKLWRAASRAWLEHTAPDVFADLDRELTRLTGSVESQIREHRRYMLNEAEEQVLGALRDLQDDDPKVVDAVRLLLRLAFDGAESPGRWLLACVTRIGTDEPGRARALLDALSLAARALLPDLDRTDTGRAPGVFDVPAEWTDDLPDVNLGGGDVVTLTPSGRGDR